MGCNTSSPTTTIDQKSYLVKGRKLGSRGWRKTKFEHRYNVLKQVADGKTEVYMVSKVFPDRVEVNSDDASPDLGVLVMQVMDLSSATPPIRRYMENDMLRMKEFSHKNSECTAIGINETIPHKVYTAVLNVFDVHMETTKLALVTELCLGEDLDSVLPCSESLTRSVISQILEGVHYMHSKGHFGHELTTANSEF